jgi:hypothetical protein
MHSSVFEVLHAERRKSRQKFEPNRYIVAKFVASVSDSIRKFKECRFWFLCSFSQDLRLVTFGHGF